MIRVRIVTYNVHGLRRGVAPVARVLRELDADIVCVQEAPRLPGWRGRSAALARQARLLYTAGGGTTGGTALFTAVRVDAEAVYEHRLPRTPGLQRRGVVLAELAKSGVRLHVGSVHLGLDAAERARHVTHITGLVNRMRPADVTAGGGGPAPEPVTVLAGDVNETPQGVTWSRLAAQFTDAGAAADAPTFPAATPRRRIDGVFLRGPAEVVSTIVVDTVAARRASDHLPVVTDLIVSPPGS